MTQGKVSIAEIAAACGVSRQVVSVVLSGRASKHVRASEETRRRVLAAVRRLGYRQNRTALNFQQRRHGSIGLLAENLHHVDHMVLDAMIAAARQEDLLLVIEQISAGPEWPKLVREDCVDGLLLFENVDPRLLDELLRLRLPVLQVNTNQRYGPGCLTCDEEGAVALALREFVRLGRRHPAYIGDTEQPHFSTQVRPAALTAVAAELGLGPVPAYRAPSAYGNQAEPLADFLRAHPRTDCLLLYSDAWAPPLYQAAARLGRRIPADLAVIAFNDSPVARAVAPSLSTLGLDRRDQGATAIRLLKLLMAGEAEAAQGLLSYELFRRASTSP